MKAEKKIFFLILAFGIALSVFAGDILKFNVLDNGSALEVGRAVKLVSAMRIDYCGTGEQPIGMIVGIEGPSSSPEYYLVANSGIATNALCGGTVTAGDKVVPFNSGSIRRQSEDPSGVVIGVAMESGTFLSLIKVMIGIESGGGSQTLQQTYDQGGNTVQMTATDGDIRFYNDGGDELLFLDESSGFVGIGETSPSTKLQIGGALKLNTLSEPASPTAGTVYSSGTGLYFYDGSAWRDLTAGGAGGGSWNVGTDYIYYADNANARVYKSASLKPYFYSSSSDSDGAWFQTTRPGVVATTVAGVRGVASGNVNNVGVYGSFTTGRVGYLGGKNYGAFGRFESSPRWTEGMFGAPDTAVIGRNYSHTNIGYGGYFEVEADNSSTSNAYGVYGYANTNAPNISYGIYGIAKANSSTGKAYGVYGTATSGNWKVGVYGLASSNNSTTLASFSDADWVWIEDIGGSGSAHGGWVSTIDGVSITDNEKAAIYGKNTGTEFPVGITGNATSGSSGTGVAGFGSKIGILGISTGSGTSRAGGAFHCNNWGSKGSSSSEGGVGVISSGGSAGAVTVSPFLGIYSATTIDSKGGAAYFCGNSYTANGFSVALLDTAVSKAGAPRVAAYEQVNLEAKIQVEGISTLQRGRGSVKLPEAFVKAIKADQKPIIILTPYSAECAGLAVARIEQDGFSVIELNEGYSSCEFSWMAVATRRDFSAENAVPSEVLPASFDADFSRGFPSYSTETEGEQGE